MSKGRNLLSEDELRIVTKLLTLNLMFKLFFEDCQLRNLCPHTLKYYREQFNAIKRPLVTMTEKDIKLLILNTVKFVIYCVLVVKYNCSIMGKEGKI
ncbi:UNVERIFIED_ORG: integrase/recombinase XerD [Peribacillus simplex]